jgi:preprotein translocase subunit YajC
MTSTMTNYLSYILAADPSQPGAGAMQFLPFVLMFVMMYFLLIRPQRMKQKALAAQIAGMKKGDQVISAGGIHGTIANLKEQTVIVKVADNVKLEFQKSSITTVIPKGTDKSDADLANQPAASGEPLKG